MAAHCSGCVFTACVCLCVFTAVCTFSLSVIGLWSSYSQPCGSDRWDCGRWRHCGHSSEDYELTEAAVHNGNGIWPLNCLYTNINLVIYVNINEYIKLLMHVFFQDVHSRYRTEAHQDVVGRFNERSVFRHIYMYVSVIYLYIYIWVVYIIKNPVYYFLWAAGLLSFCVCVWLHSLAKYVVIYIPK